MVGEVFVAKVVGDGKVTIPLRIRDLMNIEDGDYARVTITETIKKKEERKTRREKTRAKSGSK